MSVKSNTISVRVSYMCKMCGSSFKSVSTYCSHKVKHHHSLEFVHNKSIVFEESTLQLNDNEPSFDHVVADNWHTIQSTDLQVPMEVKQEPPTAAIFKSDHTVKSTANTSIINHVKLVALNNDDISAIKTELMDDTTVKYETSCQNEDPLFDSSPVNILQENEEDNKQINYYNETETQSCFSRSDSNPGHIQQVSDGSGHDPLEDFDIIQSSQSTSTFTTAETEQKYFNENSRDSDDDRICLLHDSPASTANKSAPRWEPTARATTSNNLILSGLKFQCHLCSKQFTSSPQLGIHVSICELYNGKIKKSATVAAGPSSQPQAAVRSRISSSSRRKVKVDSSQRTSTVVNCEECSIKIRRCNLNAHLRTDHDIFVQEPHRKYVCHTCGSDFQTKAHLKRHAKVHSNERPFTCSFPGCYRAFKDVRNLNYHMKTNHPQLIT